jgi:hypothetical protein
MNLSHLQRLMVRNRDVMQDMHLMERSVRLPTDSKQVVTVTGVRRCGKTSLLRHTANNLVYNGVDPKSVVYLNFEDERIDPSLDADTIVRALLDMAPEIPVSSYHLFLDEVQALPNWQSLVYTLHESERAHLYVTGSNSNLLSVEIASAMRGRSLQFELYPYSFKEYLRIFAKEVNMVSEPSRADTYHKWMNYVCHGGFPDVCSQRDSDLQTRMLQEYFNAMLHRDLVERYGISQPVTLKYFCKRLIESIGKPTSIHKLYNELKSQGRQLSKNVLYDWAEHVENVFMFVRCPRPVQSLKKQSTGYDKFYGIDSGMVAALSSNLGDHIGKLIENAVFIHLKAKNKTVTCYSGKTECDFLVFNNGKVEAAIQVCHMMNEPATKAREVAGLLEACHVYGLKKGYIVTSNDDDEFVQDGVEIQVVPAFEFLLTNPLANQ